MLKTTFLLLSLAPLAAVAQDGTRVGGPISGFVFDSQAHELRPMLGVPGAAHLGPALVSEVELAAVAPDGSLALAVSGERVLRISGLKDLAPVTAAVEGAMAVADRIAWSPDGTLAALYSSRSSRLQLLRDVRRTPAAGAALSAPEALVSLAVSNSGELLAGTADGVYLLSGDAPRVVVSGVRPAAMAFRGSDLFVADAGADRVLMVESYATSPAVTTFASDVEEPVGVQVSADGKRLYVAAAKSKVLRAYDVAGRYATGQAELDCAPTELRAFGERDLWLLNSDRGGTDPLYVGTGAGDPAAWFVPAGREQ